MTHKFENLPYAYDALEPYIDAQTMEIHHSKHHKTYYDKFIDAIKGTPMADQSLEEIMASLDGTNAAVRNNGGGLYNHNLYWKCMSGNGQSIPDGELAGRINEAFGSFEDLKKTMNNAGVARFGSGFVWLIADSNKSLKVVSTPNQDNPLMGFASEKGTPIFCIDVWEHAYYLKYQNKRPDYLNNFWQVACWANATEIFSSL